MLAEVNRSFLSRNTEIVERSYLGHMVEVIGFAIVNVNIPAAGPRTVTGTCRIVPDDEQIIKAIEIHIAELDGTVFYNAETIHYLTQLPVIFFHKKEEEVLVLKTNNSMLFFIGADISLVELYAVGIAIENGQGTEMVFPFMAIEVPDTIIL